MHFFYKQHHDFSFGWVLLWEKPSLSFL